MWRQFRFSLCLAIVGFALPGCLSYQHPVPNPACEVCEPLESIHDDGRAGVYVFFVNGNDPFCCANLKGVRDYLSKLGFSKTYYGEICHEKWMAEELFCIHRDHPGSRFIVVGFEYGADSARRIVQAGLNRGAAIDLLLYLEPRGTFFNTPAADAGISRTIVVRNDWFLTKCPPVEGSEVISVSTRSRYDVPTRPEVLELLETEALQLAAQVPIVIYAPEPVPALVDEIAPTPRPIQERKPEVLDDWDFLKLMSTRTVKANPAAKDRNTTPFLAASPYAPLRVGKER
jgi:hypothetical protein